MPTHSSRASRARPQASGFTSAAALRGAVYKVAAAANINVVVKPEAPVDGTDVVAVAGISALDGAAIGEALGVLLDDGDGEVIALGRVLGAAAGFARGMALLEDGWRLCAGRPLR